MEALMTQEIEDRLKRIAGQVTGLSRMLAQGREVDDVLVQLSAAQGGLTEVGRLLVEERLHVLVSEAASAGAATQRREVLARASEIAARFARGAGPARPPERRSRR
jgi:CsoR family transcriptional regulator, copper-sensing transcriptional repressor